MELKSAFKGLIMVIERCGRNVNVSVEWIHLAQGKLQRRILIRKIINLKFPYKTTTFDRLCQCNFLWKRYEACSYEENTGDLATGIPLIQPCCKNKLMTFWSTRHNWSLANGMPWCCATWQSGHWLIERHFGCCVCSVRQRNFGCQLSLRCWAYCGCIYRSNVGAWPVFTCRVQQPSSAFRRSYLAISQIFRCRP
jgi:hypothetical protein